MAQRNAGSFMSQQQKTQSDSCQDQDPSKGEGLVAMPNLGFAGIPESLIINFLIFLIVLTAFIIMKKIGAAVKQLNVFGGASNLTDIGSTTQIFYSPPEANPQIDRTGKNTPEENILVRKGSGTLSWMSVLFKLKDRHFYRRSGQDAVDYLRFSRFMIVQMGFIMILGLAVILPVNMSGSLRRYDSFGDTTIANLRARYVGGHMALFDTFESFTVSYIRGLILFALQLYLCNSSELMWIHVGLVLLLIPLTFFSVRMYLKLHFKLYNYKERRLAYGNIINGVCRIHKQPYKTLMISNVPDDALNEEFIRRHFNEAYAKVHVVRIDFTYDSGRLMSAVREKMKYDYCVLYVDRYRAEHPRQDVLMHTAHCSACCGCCCGRKVEAAQFYHNKALETGDKMDVEYERAVNAPNNVIFVTFETHEDARRVMDDFSASRMCAGRHDRETSVSRQLQVPTWSVLWAPLPFYVNWEKLSTSGAKWWIRAILINIGLLMLVIFLTTPSLVLHFLQNTVINIPIATQWLPPVLLMIVTFAFLFLIQLSVHWQGYYSKSLEVYTQLRNLYIYLLLILLILPSLGLTSAEALLNFFKSQSDRKGDPRAAAVNWQCVFLPSSGSFFVNFIIAAAFFGNGMTLLRLGGLFKFFLQRAWARSDAERAEINRMRSAFAYPASYVALLVIYSIAVVYSFICPVILPFAFIFFIIRHYIDKYNLYYAITPLDNTSRLSMGIHTRAASYLYVPLFLQNLIMLAFSILRGVHGSIIIVFIVSSASMLVFLLFQSVFVHYVDLDLVDALRQFLGGQTTARSSSRNNSAQLELHPRSSSSNEHKRQNEQIKYEDPAVVQYKRIKSGHYNVEEVEPEVSGVNVSSMLPIPT